MTAAIIPDILAEIVARTRADLEVRRAHQPIESLYAQIRAQGRPRGFARSLAEKSRTGFGLVAEIKRASPSGGLIRPDFDPASVAAAYQAAGAACLSVLTDLPYFQGTIEHLQAARAACALPVLRKDFMIDPYQVIETRAIGADCILIIMACLSDAQAAELEACAFELGLDVLIEVHDRAELDRALALRSPLMGINNRNLKTLVTSLETTVELAAHVPADRVIVCESGLRSHADLLRMADHGARRFLVGESLLRHADIAAATRKLLGTA